MTIETPIIEVHQTTHSVEVTEVPAPTVSVTYPARDTRVIWTNQAGSDTPSVEAQYPDWGVQISYISGVQDTVDPLAWDQARVDTWLSNIPVDFAGPVVPDWEEDWIAAIHAGSSHPDHATALAAGIALLQYIKAARPNAQVGFYGLPTREYWDQDQAWYDAMDDAAPLFAEQKAMFPSVYDLYPSSDDPGNPNYQSARDHEREGEVVRLAIELGNGKPVYPYLWHRYHNSTPVGYQLIPSGEFRAHINHMVDVVNHNGVYVDGLVAWGAESYYYAASLYDNDPDYCGYNYCGDKWDRIRAVFLDEMEPGETIDEYITRHMPLVYRDYALAMGTLAVALQSPEHVVVSEVGDVIVEITSPTLTVEVIQDPVYVGGGGGGSGTGRVGGEFVGIIGAPLEVGQEAAVRMPYSGTISKWSIMSRMQGSIEFDVYKDVWGNFPPTAVDSIVGAAPPTMTDDDNAEDEALTGWTKTVSEGDVLVFAIAGVDGTLSHAILQLDITPT